MIHDQASFSYDHILPPFLAIIIDLWAFVLRKKTRINGKTHLKLQSDRNNIVILKRLFCNIMTHNRLLVLVLDSILRILSKVTINHYTHKYALTKLSFYIAFLLLEVLSQNFFLAIRSSGKKFIGDYCRTYRMLISDKENNF